MDRLTDAFVIWIDDAPAAASGFAGRVEHVQTAERGSFGNTQELLAFFAAHRRGTAIPSDTEKM